DATPLLDAIRAHLRDTRARDGSRTAVRAEAEAAAVWSEIDRRVTSVKRWILLPRARRLLKTIKNYYVWREQCRSDMIGVVGVLRQWHLVLARRFVEYGWLDRPDDYFLLHLEETALA